MVVTKADIYNKVISAERPACPHCSVEMKIWECPETGFSCGSGWGTPYLFVCMNDQCPPFVSGWESMRRTYGRRCSYRCMCFPDSRKTEMMMVFSYVDCNQGIVDESVIASDRVRGTDADPAVIELRRCFERGDLDTLMANLFDETIYYKVRIRASELIGELGRAESIEPLRSHNFGDKRVDAAVRNAIERTHEINRSRECPYCAEIIEAEASVCDQCGRELRT